MRRSFYYFFYFQLHRIFIDSKGAAKDMHQSIQASLADLGLDKKEESKSLKKEPKMKIPLHENLPRSEFIEKEAPEPFAEMKYF